METNNLPQTYNTLEELLLRKEQLSDAIDAESEKISALWSSLSAKQENSTKGEYIASIVANTITAIDAFLLIRKLMNNYSGLFSFFKARKKRR